MKNIDKTNIREFLNNKKDNIVKDISLLVEIASIRDLSTASKGAPFGKEIRAVFNKFTEIAQREKFEVEDFDGYALHMEIGSGEEVVGILAHLDIVPVYDESEWETNPFILVEQNGALYGRGVNDDKGPIIGCLYALILLRELGVEFKRRVRLILGGSEETTWECMDHYFKENIQPTVAFSPDGNFPIVNGEKGILYYNLKKELETINNGTHNLIQISSIDEDGFVCNYVKAVFETNNKSELMNILGEYNTISEEENRIIVEYTGERSLSRNPDRAYNCVFKLCNDLDKIETLNSKGVQFRDLLKTYFTDAIHGEKVGLYENDDEMGLSTLCIMNIKYDNYGFDINFDYRYPKGIEKDYIINRFNEIAELENATINLYKELDLLYVNPNSELIRKLGDAYKKVFNEDAELISKGAASYARVLENGVAFGPTIEGDKPNSHQANENIRIETLFKAIEVYTHAIYNLACK